MKLFSKLENDQFKDYRYWKSLEYKMNFEVHWELIQKLGTQEMRNSSTRLGRFIDETL